MSDHYQELIQELQAARQAQRRAMVAMDDAHSTYIQRRADHALAKSLVEEILQEIETGSTGRPILDVVNRPPADPSEPKSGLDLVTSHPGSSPEVNGGIESPKKPARKRGGRS